MACPDKIKKELPELYEYLKSKAGREYNEATGEGKQEWIKAAKELQEHAISAIHDVYHQVKVPGFVQPSKPIISEKVKGKFAQFKNKKANITDEGIDAKAKELLDKSVAGAAFKGMNENESIKFISEQAQNVQSDGSVSNLQSSEAAYNTAVRTFGKELTDAAIAKHPLESLLKPKEEIKKEEPLSTVDNLKDVESTKNALYDLIGVEGKDISVAWDLINKKDRDKIERKLKTFDAQSVLAEAYHKAKEDGNNPELVKAVEKYIGETSPEKPTKESDKAETKPEPLSTVVGDKVSDIEKRRKAELDNVKPVTKENLVTEGFVYYDYNPKTGFNDAPYIPFKVVKVSEYPEGKAAIIKNMETGKEEPFGFITDDRISELKNRSRNEEKIAEVNAYYDKELASNKKAELKSITNKEIIPEVSDKKNPTKQSIAKKVYKDIGEIDQPTDARGLALAYLAGGGKVSEKGINEVAGTVKRATLNTGAKEKKSGEVKARDYADKNAPSTTEIAHSIWDNLEEDVQQNVGGFQNIHNELMDVINSHNTRLSAALELKDMYVEKVIDKNLTKEESELIGDELKQDIIKHFEGLTEEQQGEIVEVVKKYQNQYGLIDWEKLEQDTNGFNTDILSLPLETIKALNEAIQKNISTGQGERNNTTAQSSRSQEESGQEKIRIAQSAHEKAVKDLKTAEDKISQKQATQTGMFGESAQKEMFGVNRDEAKSILDPLRQKVNETKAELDRTQSEFDSQDQRNQPSLFEEPKKPEVAIGDIVKFKQPAIVNGKPGETNKAGTVLKIKDNGDYEVRSQQGDYLTIKKDEIIPKSETPIDAAKKSFADKAREVADNIEKNGLNAALPDFLKATLPEGTEQAGFAGNKLFDKAVAKAIRLVADGMDAGKDFVEAIKEGFEHLKKYYSENTKSFDEDKVHDDFLNHVSKIFAPKYGELKDIVKDLIDEGNDLKTIQKIAANELGNTPELRKLIAKSFNELQIKEEPKQEKQKSNEPPKPQTGNIKEDIPEGDGSNELKEMALNIPNEGKIREYESGETIKKYNPNADLQNEQKIIVQELMPALEHGENIIEKAKEVFGQKDYVEKTLQFIDESQVPNQSKGLMYISLENDLERQKQINPNSELIQKQQNLVRTKSQDFLRQAALTIGFGRLRKIGLVGHDISMVTDNFFSSKEKEFKRIIEKTIEADANTINKEAEVKEVEEVELQQKINDAVEAEINKIHEKLSPERKRNSDKAIAALENFQKKIRSKTYDATLGIPVAIIDTGITIIKNAIKAGVKIADAIDLGIQHIKEKYGKEWAKEGEFKQDMIDGFREQGIKKEASGTPKQIVKRALIESGFGKEITVTVNEKDADGKTIKKDGKPVKIKEKRNILDWKKLTGEEKSIDRMKENVSNVLEKQGYSKEEISDIQKDLKDEYIDLGASIIEHGINELNRRNQKHITPEQKSAARKLSELYNYGLFEKDPVEYDVLLSKAIGIDRLSPERFRKAHELGKALEILYSSKFNGKRLNDLELKTALQSIEEKMRILLHDEAQGHGSTALKLADITRTYMDATQRMILNNLGQAIQNPLSGFEQTLISNIDRLFDNSSTPELRAQKRKVAISVYKDMVLSGGVNYGDVNTQFVSRGNLDAYINKMSDSKLFHAIASTAIGKTTLDAADSFYKSKLTDQKFTYNLIKVLQQKRLVDGKLVEGMSKQDAVNYVSEKLTGQSFEAAKKTAKEIIEKINSGGKKIVNDSDAFTNRLANDIVKAALINGNVITTEQVTMAYNAAYTSAGRSLGHVANNPISLAVQGASAKIETKINEAVKNKEFKKAAFLTYQSIFFRNIMNPFVGGGTNWVVLKLEKNGLGLVTGLVFGRTKLDLTSEAGLKDVEKALYEEARDRDSFMRGAIGGTTALLTAMLWFGVSSSDDYRKWRNKNKWATKYLDYITPEAALATMAAKNDELGYYAGTIINKNISYDKGYKIIKGVDKATGKGKKGEAAGQFGEAVGGSFGIPVPWRLVRDVQNIWLGAEGKEPYKVSSTKSKGFLEGAFKAGMVDYIKNNPIIKK